MGSTRKNAEQFRRMARQTLQGRWPLAVGVSLIAALVGAINSGGLNITTNIAENFDGLNVFGHHISLPGNWLSVLLDVSLGWFVLLSVAKILLRLVVGSVVSVGYSRFLLNLTDRQDAQWKDLISCTNWKSAIFASVLCELYVLGGLILFVVPGILLSYSYSMVPYVLAEHPELSAQDALKRSKELMDGNRWRLFCLDLSFLGWVILAVLTLGIGNLFLNPYRDTARAAFYREISGTENNIPR